MEKKDNLKEYKARRDFDKTIEPKGEKGKKGRKSIFVIQKHDASNLHYDFRLEVDGVLKSWALPKGPTVDKNDKRLAILTEDHPLEYADFEGAIPEDEYGGGTVIVWDAGKFTNLREEKEGISIKDCFEEGKIEIELHGKKLEGGFVLIKTGDKDDKWLFKKMDDKYSDGRRKPLSTQPESILSGKSIKEMEGAMARSTDDD